MESDPYPQPPHRNVAAGMVLMVLVAILAAVVTGAATFGVAYSQMHDDYFGDLGAFAYGFYGAVAGGGIALCVGLFVWVVPAIAERTERRLARDRN